MDGFISSCSVLPHQPVSVESLRKHASHSHLEPHLSPRCSLLWWLSHLWVLIERQFGADGTVKGCPIILSQEEGYGGVGVEGSKRPLGEFTASLWGQKKKKKNISHKAIVFLFTLTVTWWVLSEVKLVVIWSVAHWAKSFISPSSMARRAPYYIGQLVYIVPVS